MENPVPVLSPEQSQFQSEILEKINSCINLDTQEQTQLSDTLRTTSYEITRQLKSREDFVLSSDIASSYRKMIFKGLESRGSSYNQQRMLESLGELKTALGCAVSKNLTPDEKEIIKDFIQHNTRYRVEEAVLVNALELTEIPSELIEDDEVSKKLSHIYIDIKKNNGAFHANYLNGYLTEDARIDTVSKIISDWYSSDTPFWSVRKDKHESGIELLTDLVKLTDGMDREHVEKAVILGVIRRFSDPENLRHFHLFEDFLDKVNSFGMQEKLIENADVIDLVKKGMCTVLSQEYFVDRDGRISKLIAFFKLGEEFTSGDEFHNSIQLNYSNYLVDCAGKNELSVLENWRDEWDLFLDSYKCDADLKNKAYIQAVGIALNKASQVNEHSNEQKFGFNALHVLITEEAFKNPQLDEDQFLSEEFQVKFFQMAKYNLVEGSHNSVDLLLYFPLTADTQKDEAIKKYAEIGLQYLFRYGVPSNDALQQAKMLTQKFELDQTVINNVLLQAVKKDIYNFNDFQTTIDGAEMFGITVNELYPAVAGGILELSLDPGPNIRRKQVSKLQRFLDYRTEEPKKVPPDSVLAECMPYIVSGLLSMENIDVLIQFNKLNGQITKDLDSKVLSDPGVQNGYKSLLKKLLILSDKSALNDILRILDPKNSPTVSAETLQTEDLGLLVDELMVNCLTNGEYTDRLNEGLKLHSNENFIYRQIVDESIRNKVFDNIIKSFDATGTGLYASISNPYGDYRKILASFNFPEDQKKMLAKAFITVSFNPDNLFNQNQLARLKEALTLLNVNLSDDEVLSQLPKCIQSLRSVFEINSIEELVDFTTNNISYVRLIYETRDEDVHLTKADLAKIDQLPVERDYLSAEITIRSGLDLEKIESEEDHKKFFEALRGKHIEWEDKQTISEPFEEGAKIFGYKRMFKYIDREGLSKHDALHAFPKIINLYNASGLTANEFWGNILEQIKREDGVTEEGTAHHQLNSIALSFNTDFEGLQKLATQFPNDPEIKEIAELLSDPKKVFASWERLKFASSRTQLLMNTELLEQLESLKGTNDKQYRYLKTLLVHPASKVDSQAVLEFWQDPDSFWQRMASHTPDQIQDKKKPSNFLHVPNLPVTAEELRDALIDGTLDKIQAFSPLEIKYKIPTVDNQAITSLNDLALKALGKRSENIKGVAKDPGKLFSELNKYLKSKGLILYDLLQGKITTMDEGVRKEIRQVILNEKYGVDVTWQEVTAQIFDKSNPLAAIVGNDTENCMPWGDGKTSVYLTNLNTGQFAMVVNRVDGTRRTIAQSVMTKDKDLGINLAEKYKEYLKNVKKEDVDNMTDAALYTRLLTEDVKVFLELIPQSILNQSDSFAAADNIEVAPNWKGEYEKVIEAIYQDYFKEYMERFGEEERFDRTKLVIGQGYSDAMTHLPTQKNTFVPQAPVSYSDKLGDEVFTLDLTKRDIPAFDKEVVVHERPSRKTAIKGEQPKGVGISFLTYEDSLAVAYMEGKSYEDNPTMLQYIHNMENALIGMQINNTRKELSHMSLKYNDKDGKMRGYLFAFEGRKEDYEDYDEDWKTNGERILYVMDLASDRQSEIASGRLITSFIELYQKNYLDKGNLIPLYMEARESTSYKIIQKHLDKIGNKLGIEFEIEELEQEQKGKDTMHSIIIRPKK